MNMIVAAMRYQLTVLFSIAVTLTQPINSGTFPHMTAITIYFVDKLVLLGRTILDLLPIYLLRL